MSNLCPNASDPQSDSGDLPDDHETSSEWKFEGHIYFEADRWPSAWQGKLVKTAEPDRELLKLPIRDYVQAKLGSRRQWRKWIEAAALE